MHGDRFTHYNEIRLVQSIYYSLQCKLLSVFVFFSLGMYIFFKLHIHVDVFESVQEWLTRGELVTYVEIIWLYVVVLSGAKGCICQIVCWHGMAGHLPFQCSFMACSYHIV